MQLQKQPPFTRGAGILLPIFSLPSPYGIGSLGKEAFAFVDFLKQAKQRYWQVLPLGPTSYGDSPYQSFSAFAGNPYLIDLEQLIEDGLLQKEAVEAVDWGGDPCRVDYEILYHHRFALLKQAFAAFEPDEAYTAFLEAHQNDWLEEYASYMAIKNHLGGLSWQDWPDPLRMREPDALAACTAPLQDEIAFWKWTQYEFFTQWAALKQYANEAGISIIGDIPIYVALDSADVWCHPEQFQLDERLRPTRVAGVPPDLFSATGQLWGNPLYRWDYMEKTGFDWWKQRIAANAALFDLIRIDHFIGIVNYYSIPAGDETAENGCWVKGPKLALIAAINEAANGTKIIAEDLGVLTEEVAAMRDETGYPGMAILQFAFDSGSGNSYLPHRQKANQVVYGGTHDNETLAGHFAGCSESEKAYLQEYLNLSPEDSIPDAVIRIGYMSPANTVIFPMQDYLGLDNSARINAPSTLGGNWSWRMASPNLLSDALAARLARLSEIYGR